MTSIEQNMTSTKPLDALNATTIPTLISELISENNKLIEKMITKLNNDLLRKIENLSNPDLIVPKTRRTRTITPVSDDDRCNQLLVSGKNKGSKCSKKATIGSLCTMHNKKVNAAKPAADEPAADEPAADEPPADEPAADEPPADEPAADEPPAPAVEDEVSEFMKHLQE
jgi:hypothetical protein